MNLDWAAVGILLYHHWCAVGGSGCGCGCGSPDKAISFVACCLFLVSLGEVKFRLSIIRSAGVLVPSTCGLLVTHSEKLGGLSGTGSNLTGCIILGIHRNCMNCHFAPQGPNSVVCLPVVVLAAFLVSCQVIKEVRVITGLGLREAKEMVESLPQVRKAALHFVLDGLDALEFPSRPCIGLFTSVHKTQGNLRRWE